MNIVSCQTGTHVLALDVSGRPTGWLEWSNAATLYCRGQVAWEAGETRIEVRGGRNRATSRRSRLLLSSVAAVRGAKPRIEVQHTPPLGNRALFLRDRDTCMYCGKRFSVRALTRDHVLPRSRGGEDTWTNVTTACLACNGRKGNRTPEEAGMALLAVPYAPDFLAWLKLCNRRILADQMEFLSASAK